MLLTLDLATWIGWTLGAPSDLHFRFGTHKLPSAVDIGPFAEAYNLWLDQMLARKVTMVVFEAPILPREVALITARKLYGLAWHTEWQCTIRQVAVFEAHLQSVKKFLTGDGRAKKPQMIEAARGYGYEVTDDNQADAIGIRLLTIQNRFPELATKFSFSLGPLGAAAHGERSTDVADGRRPRRPPQGQRP